MRPVRDAGDVAMLLRIDMDVVDAPAQVVFVANPLFPVAALPDAAFGFFPAALREPLTGWKGAREVALDVAPAGSVVVVALGQAPGAMQMVGQDRPGEQGERSGGMGHLERFAQGVEVVDEQRAPAFQQIDGEEVGAARHPDASIVGHTRNIAPRPQSPPSANAASPDRDIPNRNARPCSSAATEGGSRPALREAT